MTERDWLTAAYPKPLLNFLRNKGKAGDRKLRLIAVQCCRITRRNRGVGKSADLECVERLADGADNLEEVRRDWGKRRGGCTSPEQPFEWCSDFVRWSHQPDRPNPNGFPTHPELIALFHEVFGNPFRPVTVDPSWLTADVRLLAQGIYDEKAFDRMPILADALQDAGCENEDILSHCRDANAQHVRGCWVVDLVLGKQ